MSKKKGVAKPRKEGLVIDSSVAIAWCFPDEQDTYSQSVLEELSDTHFVRFRRDRPPLPVCTTVDTIVA